MFNNYNIYDKINMILNKDIDKNILYNDEFFNYIKDNYLKKQNNNINVTELRSILVFNNNKHINENSENSENDENNENDENDENNKNNEQYYLVKKLYKKLCLKFHPDKKGDPAIFIKVSEYYENDFLIGMLSICYNHNINIPNLNCVDERKILNEFIFLLNKLNIYK